MDLYVLNTQFEKIAIIDAYQSVLWTDRYREPGEFEIYTPVTEYILQYAVAGYYLQTKESEHTMIIEDITIESDVETGNHIKIVGRSLESILDRRIVWAQTDISGNLQNGIKKLITDAIINPSIADRQISNFIFSDSEDEAITSLTMDNQYTGDGLLDVVRTLCELNEIGFKVVLNDENQFVFSLYKGIDRSYRQETLPYVVFKPSFENIIRSNYSERTAESKTITLVAGEGEGSSRVTRVVGEGSGLTRREIFTDARDISSDDMTTAQYYAKLDERGKEKLSDNKVKKTFDGECETTRMFVYQRDFYMGDCVQVSNEYGMESPTRIIEYIWSSNDTGTLSYPTFEALEYEEEESDGDTV